MIKSTIKNLVKVGFLSLCSSTMLIAATQQHQMHGKTHQMAQTLQMHHAEQVLPHCQGIVIDYPWIRHGNASAPVLAGYMRVQNRTNQADRLIHLASGYAQSVEIHTMKINQNGLMTMRQIPALDLPEKQTVILRSGGLHLMLMQPKPALHQRQAPIALMLTFQHHGKHAIFFDLDMTGEQISQQAQCIKVN